MKKVFATILAVALVAVLVPATASAAGVQQCGHGGMLIPCRTPMPPSSKGTKGTGGSISGTSTRGGSTASGTSSNSRGSASAGHGGALPPVGIR